MKLKDWRTREGLSQQDVADMINVERSTISRYEITGDRTPSLKVAQKIIKLTGGWVTLDDLVNDNV